MTLPEDAFVLSEAQLASMTVEQKRALALALLQKKSSEVPTAQAAPRVSVELPEYTKLFYDNFMFSQSPEHSAARRYGEWVDAIKADKKFGFEMPRAAAQRTEVVAKRDDGERLSMLNFSSYNYFGYGYHPEVIAAAKAALDRYGLGAASSPVISGTLELHAQLEQKLLEFFGLPDRGVSLFSSGYAVNTGTISAFVHKGHHVVLDRNAHASLLEGAQLSRANISYFRHNDVADLERVLAGIAAHARRTRILVGTEGVFSADGDFGKLAEISALCRQYGAHLLVDEAHSVMIAGARGRGVAEAQDVLEHIDLLVITFSKVFGAVGGALIARREIARYVSSYAKCRMFSCALDPAASGGILRGLELGASEDGAARRERIVANARQLRSLLEPRVNLGNGESWIVPVFYGSARLTFPVHDDLQRRGLDAGIMQFPAVPKNESRIRLFVSSEHTREQLELAARIVIETAKRFGFAK